ncbi:MAG: hypothetical protein AMJ42_04815 [Deltaproteobacteria bacterium DG_8]|nr:MAG: hypothetical protein AMJ42_04815 [Deltaproteobacteria bacterium DG_8]
MDSSTTTMTFIVALQTSIMLGILHGISPCEHSWPMLAPFAIASKSPKRLMKIALFFCLGTTGSCIVLGATLGAIGMLIPASWDIYIATLTSSVLIVLGTILIFKPHWLHFHDEDHNHKHHGDHHTHTQNYSSANHDHSLSQTVAKKFKHGIYWGVFSVGFVNMIVPCPTAAVMYTYAIVARDAWQGAAIFIAYAIATTIVLLIITYFLAKASLFLKKMGQERVEVLITRLSGILIAAFGIFMVLIQFPIFEHLKPDWIL